MLLALASMRDTSLFRKASFLFWTNYRLLFATPTTSASATFPLPLLSTVAGVQTLTFLVMALSLDPNRVFGEGVKAFSDTKTIEQIVMCVGPVRSSGGSRERIVCVPCSLIS